jgi:uncharacterized protein (TIGR03492 family)
LGADLHRGWLGDLLARLRALRALRPRRVVGVGDLLPAAAAAIAGLPCVLVGCNKTDYYSGWGESYLAIEIAALRCWGTEVLPRDLPTCGRLERLGLQTRFLGNVMPDLVGTMPPPGDAVALLPGSRLDARVNLPIMLEAVARWDASESSVRVRRSVHVVLAAGFEDLASTVTRSGAEVCDLARALAPAGVVIATAGTASEVAAAHGRPVVAFPGPGPQYTRSFARRQRDLLGPALLLCDRDPAAIARIAAAAIADPELRAAAAAAGRERVGGVGAARAIASHLSERLGSHY